MTDAPKRYCVDYADQKVYDALLERRGGDPDRVYPDEYWTWEEFDTLDEAKAFCDQQLMSAFVRERRNIRDTTPYELARRGVTWADAEWDESDILYET